MITESVIVQIDAIIESEIDKNPYMKVFIEADSNLISNAEKD